MAGPMTGVRVLEVAQYTFVPAAGAILADWGAAVVKVEHAERGDAQRGIVSLLGHDAYGDSFYPVMEGPNRGKRSIGLALDHAASRPVLEELVRRSDVFLTNYLPSARAKLGVDVDAIRAINPEIIYVRGSGFGARGPEADKGGYDSTAFWARGGSAAGVTPPGADPLSRMPSGAYGDSIGGMTVAGGIAAALSGSFRTADGRWIEFTMLQPGRYWPEFCRAVGQDDLATDPRFDTSEKLMANAASAADLVADAIGQRSLAQWQDVLRGFSGQWAVVQTAWEVGQDSTLRANGYIAPVTDVAGIERELVASPVQFDETPPTLTRAPLFAEHTDDILRELGHSEDDVIALKVSGAVT